MYNALIGALVIAAVSTLGDFVWAGLHLRHRMVYGLAHGCLLFLCIGAYFGSLERQTLKGALYGAAIGLAAAGSFYLLAPMAGYSVMFFVWAFVWIALAFLVYRILPAPIAPIAPVAPVAPPVIRGRPCHDRIRAGLLSDLRHMAAIQSSRVGLRRTLPQLDDRLSPGISRPARTSHTVALLNWHTGCGDRSRKSSRVSEFVSGVDNHSE